MSSLQTMQETENFSLWLPPASAGRLKSIIDALSSELHTPKWNPHITLLGGITTSRAKAVELAKKVAQQARRFTVELTDVTSQPTYFQAVTATPTPRDKLDRLHDVAKGIFSNVLRDGNREEAFRPHLSLVYGNLGDDVKERVMGPLRESGDSERGVLGSEVELSVVQVWKICQAVENWEMVGEVSFSG
ncbi:RNA ligase/cyclic nucleotide phosphodiesterase [Powellomyces hirtus]|nr:RNA ligase/cyclic nucleotide phosphodiesterase [Powellomyces hirtus]